MSGGGVSWGGGVESAIVNDLGCRGSAVTCFASMRMMLWTPPCLGMKPGLLTIRVR